MACAGFGLVELLVAMTIGLAVLAGVLTVTLKARDAHAALETTARLQELARYALGVIESDVRMGGHLGLAARGTGGQPARPLTDPDGNEVAFAGCASTGRPTWRGRSPAGPHARPLAARSPLPAERRLARRDDGLIVRRASADRIGQSAAALRQYRGHVLLVTSRTDARVFVADALGTIPAGFAPSDPPDAPPLADTRRLLVNAYYVSPGRPSPRTCRRCAASGWSRSVGPGRGDPARVEDLQVQYGSTPTATSPWIATSTPTRSVRTSGRGGAHLAARARRRARPIVGRPYPLCLREPGRAAAAQERAFRRLVVSRTVQLRNARSP